MSISTYWNLTMTPTLIWLLIAYLIAAVRIFSNSNDLNNIEISIGFWTAILLSNLHMLQNEKN